LLVRVIRKLGVILMESFDLLLLVLVSVVLLDLGRQSDLDVAANFAAVLAMAITDAKKMQRREALYIWLQNILVLVNFVRILWVVSSSGRERKFTNYILTL
jgi:hypothetical protein